MFYNYFNTIKNITKNKIILLLILALGLGLRVFGISQSYIWRDEAYSWNSIQFGFNNIFDVIKWDTHPPLFSYLLYFWTSLFGQSAIGLRSMSVLFGMIAILLMYLLAYRQTNSNWIACVSALLVAVNPELIIYSQESRSYAMFTTLTIALVYTLSQKLNTNLIVISSAIALVALYTHSLFLIVIPLIFLWHWYFYSKKNQKNVFYLFAITAIGYLPYLSVIANQTKDKGEDFWLKFDPYTALDYNLKGLFTSYMYDINLPFTPILLNAIIYTVIIGLVLAVFQEYINNRIRLVIIPFVFLAVMYGVSFITPIFYIRYIQYVIPFVILLLAIGFYRVYVSNKVISVLFVSLITISSVVLYVNNIKQVPMNANYEQALVNIKSNNVTNVFNPDPDLTFDVVAYYNTTNKMGLNNYILPHPQLTNKQFQKGIIKPYNFVSNFIAERSFVVITEGDNQYAKAFVNGNNFCIWQSSTVGIINLDYYKPCEL